MPRRRSPEQILRMSRYVSQATKDGEGQDSARDRAWKLEKAGRLGDDGNLRLQHPHEVETLPVGKPEPSED
jgi:hypothetical protein